MKGKGHSSPEYMKKWKKEHAEKVKTDNKKNHAKWIPRQLLFKGKRIYVEKNPRIGVCSWCRAVVGIDCKQTQMHHFEYHDNDPLKDAIELCTSCHNKTKIHKIGMKHGFLLL